MNKLPVVRCLLGPPTHSSPARVAGSDLAARPCVDAGQKLLQARQKRKLTLAEISRNTKIPVHTLEAIERNDVDRLPPVFFARAFVRTYAQEVGVRPDDVLDALDLEPPPAETDETIPEEAAETGSSRLLFLAAGVIVACGLAYAYFAAPPPLDEIPIATRAVVPPPAAVPTATSGSVDVEFEVKSQGGCFVTVTTDGRSTASQLIPPGEPVTVKTAGDVVLRIGGAGACNAIAKPAAAPRPVRRPSPHNAAAAPGSVDEVPVDPIAPSDPLPEPPASAEQF